MARTWNRRFMGVVSLILRLMPMGIILKGLINGIQVAIPT
jgi:hypothetical protein